LGGLFVLGAGLHARGEAPDMPDIARASARYRLDLMLDPTAWPRAGLSPLNRAVVLLILVSVAGAVLESEPLLYEGRERFWFGLEVGFAVIFLVEYLARLWICVESPSYRGAVRGRLAYAFSPAALLDLIAVVPLIFAFAGTEAFLLRCFRMARILRLARLGRFSLAMLALRDAIASRRCWASA
jgi:voltage-gated potassium channel